MCVWTAAYASQKSHGLAHLDRVDGSKGRKLFIQEQLVCLIGHVLDVPVVTDIGGSVWHVEHTWSTSTLHTCEHTWSTSTLHTCEHTWSTSTLRTCDTWSACGAQAHCTRVSTRGAQAHCTHVTRGAQAHCAQKTFTDLMHSPHHVGTLS